MYGPLLTFDPATEAAVVQVWEALRAAGFDTPLSLPGLRPHVSLFTADDLDLPSAKAGLAELAARFGSFPLTLGALGVFTAPGPVTFLAPVVSQRLLDLHAAAIAALAPGGALPIDNLYRPGVWVPHVTLALGYPPERLPEIMEIVRHMPLPLTAQVTGIDLFEHPPFRVLTSISLTG